MNKNNYLDVLSMMVISSVCRFNYYLIIIRVKTRVIIQTMKKSFRINNRYRENSNDHRKRLFAVRMKT